MNFRSKLLVSLLCVSLFPLIIGNSLFHVHDLKTDTQFVIDHLESVASIQHSRISAIYQNNIERLKLVTSRTRLKANVAKYDESHDRGMAREITHIISDAKNAIDSFVSMSVYSLQGDLIASTKSEMDLPDVQAFLSGKESEQANIFSNTTDSGLLVHLSGPIEFDGQVIGVLVVEASTENMMKAIDDYTGLGESGETILATRNERNDAMFLTPTRFNKNAALNLTISSQRNNIPIINAINGEEDIFHDFIDYRDVPVLAVTRHVKTPAWGIVVKIDKQEAFSAITEKKNKLIMIGVILISLIIYLSFWLANKLTRPVNKLTDVAQKIIGGDLESRADENSEDEMGLLSKTFNLMTSKQKQAQQELLEKIEELKVRDKQITLNAKRFERWQESNFIGIVHSNSDGTVFEANTTFLSMLGYSKHELHEEKLNLSELTPPEFLGNDDIAKREAEQRGSWAPYEKEYIHKSGRRTPVIVGGSMFNDAKDEFILFIVDLTTQKDAENKLKLSEEMLRISTEKAGVAVWEYDVTSKAMSHSDNYDELFGLPPGTNWDRKRFLISVHPEDRAFCNRTILRAMCKGGQDYYNFDFRVLWPNKQIHWLSIVGEVISRSADGRARVIRGCFFEITERKQQEESLRRTQKMDALGKLTGGISHDFNNILGIILGYGEILSGQISDNPKLVHYVDQITIAGNRGAKLTKKLLQFSKHKGEKPEVTDINICLKSDEDMLRKTLTARVDVKLSLAPFLWKVFIDPSGFQDLILNMAINASHAMSNGGKLTISTDNVVLTAEDALPMSLAEGEYVCLTVEDTGTGMKSDVKERIFEPFFTTKNTDGTGLGLSQVYGYVQLFDGAIDVTSHLGKGTCFILYFPRFYERKETIYKEKQQPLTQYRGTESVLVVDDEQPLCDFVAEILRSNGYTVHVATSANVALMLLEQHHFDVLISDIIMPEISGYQLAKQCRHLYPHLKIVFASGYRGEETLRSKDVELCVASIAKPYSSHSVLAALRCSLDN